MPSTPCDPRPGWSWIIDQRQISQSHEQEIRRKNELRSTVPTVSYAPPAPLPHRVAPSDTGAQGGGTSSLEGKMRFIRQRYSQSPYDDDKEIYVWFYLNQFGQRVIQKVIVHDDYNRPEIEQTMGQRGRPHLVVPPA